MSIYSNENINKFVNLSPRKYPHLVQNRKLSVHENYGVYSIPSSCKFVQWQVMFGIFLFFPGYDGGSLPKTLKDIEVSDTVYLDRWHIEFSTTDSGEQGDPVPYNIINNYFSIGVVSGMQHSYLQHIYILSATCIMLFSRVHSSNVRSYYGHQWDHGPLALICKCFLLFWGDVHWPMDVPPPPPPPHQRKFIHICAPARASKAQTWM